MEPERRFSGSWRSWIFSHYFAVFCFFVFLIKDGSMNTHITMTVGCWTSDSSRCPGCAGKGLTKSVYLVEQRYFSFLDVAAFSEASGKTVSLKELGDSCFTQEFGFWTKDPEQRFTVDVSSIKQALSWYMGRCFKPRGCRWSIRNIYVILTALC